MADSGERQLFDDALKNIRNVHLTQFDIFNGNPWCAECNVLWPCAVISAVQWAEQWRGALRTIVALPVETPTEAEAQRIALKELGDSELDDTHNE